MEELNQAFFEYVDEFKKLDTKLKQEEILKSIKEIIVIFSELGKIDKIDLESLNIKEALSGNVDNSIDGFLTEEFVYLENAKNLVGQYLDKKC